MYYTRKFNNSHNCSSADESISRREHISHIKNSDVKCKINMHMTEHITESPAAQSEYATYLSTPTQRRHRRVVIFLIWDSKQGTNSHCVERETITFTFTLHGYREGPIFNQCHCTRRQVVIPDTLSPITNTNNQYYNNKHEHVYYSSNNPMILHGQHNAGAYGQTRGWGHCVCGSVSPPIPPSLQTSCFRSVGCRYSGAFVGVNIATQFESTRNMAMPALVAYHELYCSKVTTSQTNSCNAQTRYYMKAFLLYFRGDKQNNRIDQVI